MSDVCDGAEGRRGTGEEICNGQCAAVSDRCTGDTLSDCQEEYVRLLETSGISDDTDVAAETETVTGTITRIAQSVIDGNSHFYLVLDVTTGSMTCRSRILWKS